MHLQGLFEKFPVMDINRDFYLRKPMPTVNDARGYFECYNDPLVNRFIPDECIPASIAAAKDDLAYLADLFNNSKTFFWVIVRKSDDYVVGNVGFHEWNRYHNRVEIAYELNSKYWRQGIVGTAVKNVMEFAFNAMQINRAEANTVTYNRPSQALLRKQGFVLEGVLAGYKKYKGQYVDICMYGIDSRRYRALENNGYFINAFPNVVPNILIDERMSKLIFKP